MAAHELAFVEVHVSVIEEVRGTERLEALKDTDGTGSEGVGEGAAPPPPPPHELIIKRSRVNNGYFLDTFNFINFFIVMYNNFNGNSK